MAHFRTTISGNRGSASRCGTKTSGIHATVRGWDAGITIRAWHNAETGEDVFEIMSDGGTNSAPKARIVLDGIYNAEVRNKA